MKPQQQVPRNALVWMIICLFTLMAPHAARLPVWILAVYVFAAVWRILVYRGRWSLPGRRVKVLLTLSGFAGIYLSYGSLIGLEPTVALLLTASALKLIELTSRKDAYVLLFLGYFICITEFLFTQDLLIVLYSLLNVTLITTALVALHQPGEHQFNRKTIRLAGIMLLQAMPLMVVLFFMFPRIGPLWTVPAKSHTAKTGMSDFMKPGDVSRLTQSADVAFRVQFDGDIPPSSQLYWRGLVFSKLEEGAWSSLRYYDVPAAERRGQEVLTSGDPLTYSIIMEPTQQNWLYSLRYAQAGRLGVMAAADFRLFLLVPLEDRYMYGVKSWPAARLDTELSDWRRETELRLPAQDNPRTRELAQELRNGVATDGDFVDAVLNKFRTEPYVYTLQPAALPGADPMDQFLFRTRRGFCEHYAYAFVVMMRAAGVPARVVAGYQGGEVNPVNKTVIVHQFDAHAWAEVWLAGQGWVRVDPTAAVSPDRIEWGLEQAMAQEGSFLRNSPLSPLRYRSIAWVNLLRLRYDALTYRWQAWVIGFNSDQQFQLLQNVFGDISARKFAAVLLGTWALVLIPVAISLLHKRATHQLSPLDKQYLIFCNRLSRVGVDREPGETPDQLSYRARQIAPAMASRIDQITLMYNDLAYRLPADSRGGETDLLRQFTSAVARFRPRQGRMGRNKHSMARDTP
jgi:transglutaminase-like putative cysteine protease